jgi:hypothetical protein
MPETDTSYQRHMASGDVTSSINQLSTKSATGADKSAMTPCTRGAGALSGDKSAMGAEGLKQASLRSAEAVGAINRPLRAANHRGSPYSKVEGEGDSHYADMAKGKLDLIVLRYMVRRLHLTIHQLDSPVPVSQPLLYKLQERHERTHRIAIYRQQELVQRNMLTFVGFISRKRRPLSESIADEIQDVDKRLLVELVDSSGVLSYSSLELRNGDWCNLVVLSSPEAKIHIRSAPTHRYAAYGLADSYYEWIRLHTGIMPEGLDHTEMLLQKTKYYFFEEPQKRPTIRERVYGPRR